MTVREGPAFGALILGCGVGYLMFQKSSHMFLSLAVGVAVAMVDYVILAWFATLKERRK